MHSKTMTSNSKEKGSLAWHIAGLEESLRRDKTDAGKEVLAYLKSITAETVSGPNVSNNQLFHLEGMRYLFAIIQNKINKGKEQ